MATNNKCTDTADEDSYGISKKSNSNEYRPPISL